MRDPNGDGLRNGCWSGLLPCDGLVRLTGVEKEPRDGWNVMSKKLLNLMTSLSKKIMQFDF